MTSRTSGEIVSSTDGAGNAGDSIVVAGAGAITNNGEIYSAVIAIDNTDSSDDQSTLHNYGTISGSIDGVSDTGGHSDEIYNYGHIDGGAGGYAIYADNASYEYLWNAGTISGAVQLGSQGSGVVNSGTIDGEINLASSGAVTNSGVIDQIFFANTANRIVARQHRDNKLDDQFQRRGLRARQCRLYRRLCDPQRVRVQLWSIPEQFMAASVSARGASISSTTEPSSAM